MHLCLSTACMPFDCTHARMCEPHVACVCVCRACGTWGLKVERDHLAAGVPEDLRHVITGVHAASFGVDTAHLTLVVAAVTLRIFFSLV